MGKGFRRFLCCHNMTTITTFLTTQKTPATAEKFHCENCLFNTSKKSEWLRHLSTQKHNDNTSTTQKRQKTPTPIYTCDNCEKNYKDRAGLWRHKKKCSQQTVYTIPPNPKDTMQLITPDIVMEIMKQNKDIQNLLIEQNNKLIEKITEISIVRERP